MCIRDRKDHPLGAKLGVPQKISYLLIPILIIVMFYTGLCLWAPTMDLGFFAAGTNLVLSLIHIYGVASEHFHFAQLQAQAVQGRLDRDVVRGAFQVDEEHVLSQGLLRGARLYLGQVDAGIGEFREDHQQRAGLVRLQKPVSYTHLDVYKRQPSTRS